MAYLIRSSRNCVSFQHRRLHEILLRTSKQNGEATEEYVFPVYPKTDDTGARGFGPAGV